MALAPLMYVVAAAKKRVICRRNGYTTSFALNLFQPPSCSVTVRDSLPPPAFHAHLLGCFTYPAFAFVAHLPVTHSSTALSPPKVSLGNYTELFFELTANPGDRFVLSKEPTSSGGQWDIDMLWVAEGVDPSTLVFANGGNGNPDMDARVVLRQYKPDDSSQQDVRKMGLQ